MTRPRAAGARARGTGISRALRWLALRALSLFGISLVTFALVDVAPADRALLALEGSESQASAEARAATLRALRVRFGLVDAVTGEPLSFAQRYGRWLRHAVVLDFAGASEDPGQFRARIRTALPVTLLLSFLAVVTSVAVAIPLGSWLGMRGGGLVARVLDGGLIAAWALPQFLLATLLVLFLCGGIGAAWLPANGLRSPGAEAWSPLAQVLDMLRHLALPVFTLALAPTVWLTRQLAESTARVARSDFVRALRGFGMEPAVVRRRIARNALVPLATAAGTLLPFLVSGSVVVERVFGMPGLGDLSCRAVFAREVPMVMAMTMLVAVATLLGLALSDLAHRQLDPRIAEVVR